MVVVMVSKDRLVHLILRYKVEWKWNDRSD